MSLESIRDLAERKVKRAIEDALRNIQDEKRRGDIRRKYLDCGVPGSFVVHHIIPIEIQSEEIVMRAKSKGWDINDYYKNGMSLPSSLEESELCNLPYHSGSHGSYTSQVRYMLKELAKKAAEGKWDDSEVKARLEDLVLRLALKILDAGGGKSINDVLW